MKFSFKRNVLSLTLCVACIVIGSLKVKAQDDERRSQDPSTGAITGRVVDENGQPIAHAAVFVSSSRALPQPRIASTDDGGNFEVSGLDPSTYSVSASASTYVSPTRASDYQPTYYRIGDLVTINMMKGGVITGTVTSGSGEPLVQAGVRAVLIRDAFGKTPTGMRGPIERTTDDRGVYRIYGLASGTYLVSAGGRGIGYASNAYDSDAPTYAPSSTRDAAAEIVVRAGAEVAGVDIRHRGEPGHAVSGAVSGPTAPNIGPNITLAPVVNGVAQAGISAFQAFNNNGFAFYGVPDGVYELIAQSYLGESESASSEPLRITVKGSDVTGLTLVTKGMAAVRGHLALENSGASECQGKRKPTLAETMITVRRSEQGTMKEELSFSNAFTQSALDQAGDFALRNLGPGQFNLNVRYFAKYWYLSSITREVSSATQSKAANRQTDLARLGIHLKFGERVNGVKVTLREGAASLHGALKLAEGERVPAKLSVNLVPAEKENGEDVLRFFTVPVNPEGTFSFANLPPGRYWALARVVGDGDPKSDFSLRTPESAEHRKRLQRAAEATKLSVEFKPCQNVTNYELLFKSNSK